MDKIQTVGRRKEAVARLFMSKGSGKIIINKKEYKKYFPQRYMQMNVEAPLEVIDKMKHFDITINISGGGVKGQSEAIQLSIARALIKEDPEFRPALKAELLLRRDSRVVERKKFGHKKARKVGQFSKR
ncbi:MAG: 30S ribosomal protein S9 [Bacteroidetes bacterium]|nr:30S ribosomal protein S9 [Bacteroidota bacterium]